MATEKRLIDRNEIFPNGTFFANAEDPLKSLDELIKRIWSIPTVDAVEVVRCKNCVSFEEKFRVANEKTGNVYCGGYCYHWDYEMGMAPNEVDGDDFCSYGERKDNG